MSEKISTTAKIDRTLYEDFRVLGIRRKLTLQNFVERCMFFYVHDQSFRDTVNTIRIPLLSHSSSISL